MGSMKLQNVRMILGELEEDAEYQALSESADGEFNSFRQDVEITGIRCLELKPNEATDDEIRWRLQRIIIECTGKLAPFRPFIERALAEVGFPI